MSEAPSLSNASVVLNEPEKPENAKALAEYIAAKRPAEALRKQQAQWMKERHGA